MRRLKQVLIPITQILQCKNLLMVSWHWVPDCVEYNTTLFIMPLDSCFIPIISKLAL